MSSDAADASGTVIPASAAPRYYLGIRRLWWVVLCILLLSAVDAVPFVGPYLALVVLLWMVNGLARAEERSERPEPAPARAVGRRSTDSAALSS